MNFNINSLEEKLNNISEQSKISQNHYKIIK